MNPTTPASKDELLSAAAREYKAFHDALKGLNESHLSQVWLGTWSVKDIVAHISAWHRELAPALERLARGERPIAEGVSYDDVAAASVPAERFQPGKTAWRIVDGNSAHHYKEHGDQIRAWRAAKGF